MSDLRTMLQQKLLQKLSPQQIQYIKLLQIPTMALEQRIKEELEANPALEESGLDSMEDSAMDSIINELARTRTEKNSDEEKEDTEEESTDETESYEAVEKKNENEFSLEDYMQQGQEENESAMDGRGSYSEDEEREEIPIPQQTTFLENLMRQLDMLPMNDIEQYIAQQIVGSLDEDGYLRRDLESIIDDLSFTHNIKVTPKQVEIVLEKVQKLEPAGIAARNLQECLLLQLETKKENRAYLNLARKIITEYFSEFTKKHYHKIASKLELTEEEIKPAIEIISKLNPKPGEAATLSKAEYIIPDFVVTGTGNNIQISLNSKNAPELRISRKYQEILLQYKKSAKKDAKLKQTVEFVKSKIDAAKAFIDAIKQRQGTLLKTMHCIVQNQRKFFNTSNEREIKPMILKDVAQQIKMDISTVSRVASSKYVQTDFGIFPLKFFFSEAMHTESGEEVSNKEIKKILQDMIDKEDKKKPLSDEKLTRMLRVRGYDIARRTVAKYREQMKIGVARLRKEI